MSGFTAMQTSERPLQRSIAEGAPLIPGARSERWIRIFPTDMENAHYASAAVACLQPPRAVRYPAVCRRQSAGATASAYCGELLCIGGDDLPLGIDPERRSG